MTLTYEPREFRLNYTFKMLLAIVFIWFAILRWISLPTLIFRSWNKSYLFASIFQIVEILIQLITAVVQNSLQLVIMVMRYEITDLLLRSPKVATLVFKTITFTEMH